LYTEIFRWKPPARLQNLLAEKRAAIVAEESKKTTSPLKTPKSILKSKDVLVDRMHALSLGVRKEPKRVTWDDKLQIKRV
jgi:hypothetical protein